MFDFEKARKPAAALTAALALGGVSVAATNAETLDAHPGDVPAHVEKRPKPILQIAPEGVHTTLNDQEIFQEAQKAFSGIKERWNGAVVVHAPETLSSVSFNESPTAYAAPVGPDFVPETGGVIVAVEPAIERFKVKSGQTREYLATFDLNTNKWLFLDLGWAIKNGAVDFYAFADSKPKAVPYSPIKEYDALPKSYYWEHTPTVKDLRLVLDAHGKMRHIVPSRVTPHA